MSNFKIISKDGTARTGELATGHGIVKTPVFMPVGTQGTVKSLTPDDLKMTGAQIILGNTYHLYLRPGNKLIKKMGGLHKFMGWDKPILTDSGGFQAFSLGAMIEHKVSKIQSTKVNKKQKKESDEDQTALVSKFTEEGIHFVSHLDGSKHLFSPETSMEVQLDLGSDICLALDELLSPEHDPEYVKNSLERTHRWELRSFNYFRKNVQSSINSKALVFGIAQGIYDKEVRENEARWLATEKFDGISIGGSCGTSEYWPSDRSLCAIPGEEGYWESQAIWNTMAWTTPLLPPELPRHALGIGEVADFFECIDRGIDMFDCVAPTRRARNGSLYISPKNGGSQGNKFTLGIRNSQYSLDQYPIDPGCECYTCQNFSRSYLRHLYLASEILYHRLATIHNVFFMLRLVDQIRESIENKQFKKLKSSWLK